MALQFFYTASFCTIEGVQWLQAAALLAEAVGRPRNVHLIGSMVDHTNADSLKVWSQAAEIFAASLHLACLTGGAEALGLGPSSAAHYSPMSIPNPGATVIHSGAVVDLE